MRCVLKAIKLVSMKIGHELERVRIGPSDTRGGRRGEVVTRRHVIR